MTDEPRHGLIPLTGVRAFLTEHGLEINDIKSVTFDPDGYTVLRRKRDEKGLIVQDNEFVYDEERYWYTDYDFRWVDAMSVDAAASGADD